MKEQYIISLFKDGQLVTTLRPTSLKKDALALAEASDKDFDYAEVKTIYVKTERGGE